MFLSAVSALIVLAGGGDDYQGSRLTPHEQEVWDGMAPAIATLLDGDKPIAAAALIDDSGLFVASKNAIDGNTVRAKLANGEVIRLTMIAKNGATGFALLQASGWKPSPEMHPFKAPIAEEKKGAKLFALLGTGPIRSEFISGGFYGVLPKSRRVVPMCEFRFEAPAELIGTALIVCEDGELIGALNATLRKQDTGTQQNFTQGGGQGGGQSGLKNLLQGSQFSQQQNHIGPSEMTVAYTVGADVVRQVLEGFRSTNHTVEFPSLGVLCTDTIGGGATIQRVIPGSAAAKADLRVGDVIHDIAGAQVENQIRFAREMLKHSIGAKITIRVSRGNLMIVRDVVVGRAEDDSGT